MAITKTETLDNVNIQVAGQKRIRAVYTSTFTDDSTTPNSTASSTRETHYVAADTVASSEDQLVKDLAAVLFA